MEVCIHVKTNSYWFGQKVHIILFYKTKDTFFIFTNNFIDLDLLSMSPTSHVV